MTNALTFYSITIDWIWINSSLIYLLSINKFINIGLVCQFVSCLQINWLIFICKESYNSLIYFLPTNKCSKKLILNYWFVSYMKTVWLILACEESYLNLSICLLPANKLINICAQVSYLVHQFVFCVQIRCLTSARK